MSVHPESRISVAELGSRWPAYRPTYDFEDYIDSYHRCLADAVGPQKQCTLLYSDREHRIMGWLRQADALKLYELAYFAEGDILELGTYQGLSTYIIAQAMKRSPYPKHFITVDLSLADQQIAAEHLKRAGLSRYVEMIYSDADSVLANSHDLSFVFVDHSHTYDAVASVCQLLPAALAPGAFVLFHDYNDDNPDYGVYQAVADHLPASFQFSGVYGCAGLFRYGAVPPDCATHVAVEPSITLVK